MRNELSGTFHNTFAVEIIAIFALTVAVGIRPTILFWNNRLTRFIWAVVIIENVDCLHDVEHKTVLG